MAHYSLVEVPPREGHESSCDGSHEFSEWFLISDPGHSCGLPVGETRFDIVHGGVADEE